MFHIIKNYFDDWSKFEINLIIISTLIMLTSSLIAQDGLIALISGITGIVSVVLCAKGKSSTYIIGSIQVLTYAYLSFNNKLYGEVMLNLLYYIPMNIIGFFMWSRHKNDNGDIITKTLSTKNKILVFSGTCFIILAYAKFLETIGGYLPLVDAITTISTVIAVLLMVFRYAEQWFLWLFVDILSIIMWVTIVITKKDMAAVITTIMWIAYTVNAFYGYFNWIKLSKNSDAS